MENRRPLDGILVLDLTQALSGPMCTCVLADYGARVLKIENPSGKEITRGVNSNPKLELDPVNGGDSFNAINRNKDGICLNLRTDEGKAIMKELLKKADVLISNYRPGTTKKMGLDWDTVKEINPRLIACEIGAFREKGRENEAGFDVVVQAASGLIDCTGYPDKPAKVGASVTDITAGMFMVQGIMFALFNREKTGKGQAVYVRMQDAAMFLLAQYVTPLLGIPDFNLGRYGMCHFEATPSNGFKTKDGYLFIAPASDKLFATFCSEILEQPELATDPRFSASTPRMNNREELFKIIEDYFSNYTAEELHKRMSAAGLPSSPIVTAKQAFTTAYNNHEDIVATVHHAKHGDLQVIGTVCEMTDTPGKVTKPAPRLGQDTYEVLHDMLGISDERIKELEGMGVTRCYHES